eukprot:4401514-Pleurochrysis_carterae.AAC.1
MHELLVQILHEELLVYTMSSSLNVCRPRIVTVDCTSLFCTFRVTFKKLSGATKTDTAHDDALLEV